MSTQESLCLSDRLELRDVGPPHPSLPAPGHLVRLLCSIVLIPVSHMNRFGDDLPVCHRITSQFVRHDLPGFAAMATQ